jgi:hypothetical protein
LLYLIYIMKTAKVTQVQRRSMSNRERYLHDGCTVFVESNVTKLVDEFFHDNKIYALNFKCKTWSKLGTISTKATIASLREIFGPEPEIKYSRTAGCACGCSPGYRVKKLPMNSEFINKNVWATVEVDIEPVKKVIPTFQAKLEEELKAHA